ncbi:NAD(P)H-dependent flavin oxidoreductase [Janthinobacterium lividum]|uniref:NAD(P)H-dependent flavin oxidoreductase n=1 Tax=Janthinobacterium lividum TaxID=29581 RepID=UPI000445EAF5|nr:nitronate monooxygenase [Janthinobacterium lividum]EZP36715.1 2-nitropropane dioxygenase NPD [Janthinobacterium lividum]
MPLDLTELRLPLIVSPMFLVSGPDLVLAASRSGVIGSFPALNARSSEEYATWLQRISDGLREGPLPGCERAAPFAVNLIVHGSNRRLEADLALTLRHQVPVVITSLGAVRDVVLKIQDQGGIVLHDVTSVRHAEKALEAGVDGLIAVAGGAGGHAGTLNPFALVAELRQLTGKLIVLAGSIGNGGQIAAAIAAGADLAGAGTRFIATQESLASAAYKQMLLAASARDVIYTPKISGIPANFLQPSLEANGIDLATLAAHGAIDLASELDHKSKAWKDIWSAGHGVGTITDLPPVAELLSRMDAEFEAAMARLRQRARRAAGQA